MSEWEVIKKSLVGKEIVAQDPPFASEKQLVKPATAVSETVTYLY